MFENYNRGSGEHAEYKIENERLKTTISILTKKMKLIEDTSNATNERLSSEIKQLK